MILEWKVQEKKQNLKSLQYLEKKFYLRGRNNNQIINGSVDVLPEERDRSVGVGNAVIIDHQNGEYSLICHFKHNSIRVKVSEKVKQGDVLGLCGNTGNTTQPHIHFNLQDGPLMHKANALPVQFKKIIIDGIAKINAELVRGQLVSNI